MAEHHTKDKSDIAVAKTIARLFEMGFNVSLPMSEHLHYDVIADTGDRLLRIQVKHSTSGAIRKATSYATKSGNHEIRYKSSDFDYYAIYLPEVDKVCFPAFSFGGRKLKTEVPKNGNKFLWYEDFLELTNEAPEHTRRKFLEGKPDKRTGFAC